MDTVVNCNSKKLLWGIISKNSEIRLVITSIFFCLTPCHD